MEKFRSTIQFTIIKSVYALLNGQNEEKHSLNENIALIICEYSGYNEFINYKYKYAPNNKLFDTRRSTCEPFGFLSGQRVKTSEGDAIVIGVAPLPDKNPLQYELYFDLCSEQQNGKRLCFPQYKKQQFIQNGFILLDGFVNIWGQSWHSFSIDNNPWWKHKKYAINNPTNMPTQSVTSSQTSDSEKKSQTKLNFEYDDSDLSLWFWTQKTKNYEKYDKQISLKLDVLDIGRSFIFTNKEKQRVYLIIKTSQFIGFQINVETKHCRQILKGTYIEKQAIYPLQKLHNTINTSNTKWYWEGDDPNKNIWNKYDNDTCQLLNNQISSNYGAAIPYQLNRTIYGSSSHKFKYELIRLSENVGIQRNLFSDFSRRIVRQDHKDLDVNNIISQEQYNATLTKELQGDIEEKYQVKNEPDIMRPTSTIATITTLATEVSIPLTPRTEKKEKELIIEAQKMNQYKQIATHKHDVIKPNPDNKEVYHKKTRKDGWKWTKALMFTGYVDE